MPQPPATDQAGPKGAQGKKRRQQMMIAGVGIAVLLFFYLRSSSSSSTSSTTAADAAAQAAQQQAAADAANGMPSTFADNGGQAAALGDSVTSGLSDVNNSLSGVAAQLTALQNGQNTAASTASTAPNGVPSTPPLSITINGSPGGAPNPGAPAPMPAPAAPSRPAAPPAPPRSSTSGGTKHESPAASNFNRSLNAGRNSPPAIHVSPPSRKVQQQVNAWDKKHL